MVKKPFAIFYIEANKAFFYGSNVPSTLQVDIPADTLAYLDVVNRDKFYQVIQNFVTTNKIEPVSIIIVLSTYASYEKDITGKLPDEINTEIQQFLDSVPYERVLSRIYKLQDKIKVVATNKDLYEVIKHGFEKMHFPTVAITSLPLLQKQLPEIGTTVKMDLLATKIDAIKQYSLITLEEINNPGKPRFMTQEGNSEKPNPLRLYGLIGVFVVLLGILTYVVMTSLVPAPKKLPVTPVVHRARVVVTPTPTISITPEVEKTGTSSGRLLTPQTQARAKTSSTLQ